MVCLNIRPELNVKYCHLITYKLVHSELLSVQKYLVQQLGYNSQMYPLTIIEGIQDFITLVVC